MWKRDVVYPGGMGRSAASIQAEITIIETELQTAASLITTATSDSTSVTKQRAALEKRLDQLYIQLDRATGAAPMFVRGVVRGFGGRAP